MVDYRHYLIQCNFSVFSWHFNFVIPMSGVLGPYQFQRQLTMLILWRLEPVITLLKKNTIRARAHTFPEARKTERPLHWLGLLQFTLKLERSCISPRKQFFSMKKQKQNNKSKQNLKHIMFCKTPRQGRQKKKERSKKHYNHIFFICDLTYFFSEYVSYVMIICKMST